MLAIVKPRGVTRLLAATRRALRQQRGIRIRSSHVQSVHLSYRVASTGRGTGRDDAVDFREILGGEHNVRGAHILLKVLARFRAGYRDDEDSRTLSLGHWLRDCELREPCVLAAGNGLERRAQPEVLLDIDPLKAR